VVAAFLVDFAHISAVMDSVFHKKLTRRKPVAARKNTDKTASAGVHRHKQPGTNIFSLHAP